MTLRVNEEEAVFYDGKFEFLYPLPKFVELCGTEELPFRYARLFAVFAGGNLVDPFEGRDDE